VSYTTPSLVNNVLDRECSIDLTPFINAAHNLVENVCVPLCYDSGTLRQIETWLAAHFYHIRAAQTNKEEADGIADTFDSKVDLGLKVTRYGQMALILDYKGGLARLNYANMGQGVPRPNLIWLGKRIRRNPPSGWPPGYSY